MQLGSVRELSALRPVLSDPQSRGPDPVYWVFSDVSEAGKWANITLIAAGRFDGKKVGGEYPKTFGHYHGTQVDETYCLAEGEGIMILQKKHLDKKGKWIPEMVDEVFLVRARPGDELVIKPEYGHSWSNTGDYPLISFDDWRAGHSPSDYQDIKRLQGMAYYLVDDGGEPKAVPNPRYKSLPKPVWLTAAEFRTRKVRSS
jgi:glucose-6-phosphate isomerase